MPGDFGCSGHAVDTWVEHVEISFAERNLLLHKTFRNYPAMTGNINSKCKETMDVETQTVHKNREKRRNEKSSVEKPEICFLSPFDLGITNSVFNCRRPPVPYCGPDSQRHKIYQDIFLTKYEIHESNHVVNRESNF